jgi:hypothetical protein
VVGGGWANWVAGEGEERSTLSAQSGEMGDIEGHTASGMRLQAICQRKSRPLAR